MKTRLLAVLPSVLIIACDTGDVNLIQITDILPKRELSESPDAGTPSTDASHHTPKNPSLDVVMHDDLGDLVAGKSDGENKQDAGQSASSSSSATSLNVSGSSTASDAGIPSSSGAEPSSSSNGTTSSSSVENPSSSAAPSSSAIDATSASSEASSSSTESSSATPSSDTGSSSSSSPSSSAEAPSSTIDVSSSAAPSSSSQAFTCPPPPAVQTAPDPNCRPGYPFYLKGPYTYGNTIAARPGDTGLQTTIDIVGCTEGLVLGFKFVIEFTAQYAQYPQIIPDPEGSELADGSLVARDARFSFTGDPTPASGSQPMVLESAPVPDVQYEALIYDADSPLGHICLYPGYRRNVTVTFNLNSNPGLAAREVAYLDWLITAKSYVDGRTYGANVSVGNAQKLAIAP